MDPQGKIKYRVSFPIGFFPEGFYADETGISLKQGSTGFFYSWSAEGERGKPFQGNTPSGPIALTHRTEKLAFTMGDQRLLEAKTQVSSSIPDQATLVSVSDRGISSWAWKLDGGWKTFQRDPKGQTLLSGSIQGSPESLSFFTILKVQERTWLTAVVENDKIILQRWTDAPSLTVPPGSAP